MKKIVTVLLVLICLSSVGQTGFDLSKFYKEDGSYGRNYSRGKFNSGLDIVFDTTTNKTGLVRIGTTLWVGNNTYWTLTGGGGSATIDSLLWTTRLRTLYYYDLLASSKENKITVGTNSQYWRGDKSWQTLDKVSVGLPNVDNTSDADKWIASASLQNKIISLGLGNNIYSTGNKAAYFAGSGALTASTVTQSELENLSGSTSNIQTQFGLMLPITSAIATYEPKITATTSADYWRGDKTFQPLNKSAVGLSLVLNVDATNASNVSSGTLPNARLSAVPNSALANSSISFTTGASGTAPNFSSSPISLGGVANINIPLAATGVTSGTVSNTTQTIVGDKTFNGDASIINSTSDLPLINLTNTNTTKAWVTRASTNNTFSFYNKVFEVGGANGNCLLFNGGTNYLESAVGSISAPSAWTVNFWVFPSGANNTNMFYIGDGTNGFQILLDGGFNYPTTKYNRTYVNNYSGPAIAGAWHMVTVTKSSGNSYKVYIDGTLQNTASGSAISTISKLVIGYCSGLPNADLTANSAPTGGKYDQFIFYNVELAATGSNSIATLYNSGTGTATPPLQSNTVIWYEFNEGTMITANSSSTTNYTGTLYNSLGWSLVGGKIPTSSATQDALIIYSKDGVNNGERGQHFFGNTFGGTFLQGRTIRMTAPTETNTSFIHDGNTLLSPANTSQTATASSTLSIVGNVSIGSNTAAPTTGLLVAGKTGLGGATSPTALLHLAAGTASANTSPIKFTITGAVLNTTPEAGAIQVNSSGELFYSPSASTLRKIIYANATTPSNGLLPIGNGTDFTLAAPTGTQGVTITTGSGTLAVGLGAITPTSVNGVTAATMAYVDATSSIQAQIDARAISSSGTYTPTATNVTNITSSTPNITSWTKVGNIVTVFGTVTITATLAVASEVDISLPVSSNLSASTDLNGLGNSDASVASNIVINGDSTNDRAKVLFTALSVGGNGTIYFSFQYKII